MKEKSEERAETLGPEQLSDVTGGVTLLPQYLEFDLPAERRVFIQSPQLRFESLNVTLRPLRQLPDIAVLMQTEYK